MRITKYCFKGIILVFSFFHSCSALKLKPIQGNEMYEVINATLNLSDKPYEIYAKSFTDGEYDRKFLKKFPENILIGYSHSNFLYKSKLQGIKDIESDTLLSATMKDSLLLKTSKSLQLEVKDFLTEKDLIQFSSMIGKKIQWERENFNDRILITSDRNSSLISVPVFNVKGDISAYFLSTNGSLELIFCKKDKNGRWYRFAESLIWIS